VPEPPALRPTRPAAESIVAAADALTSARSPLIIAGRGARDAAARSPLEQLAELLGGMLATSAVANGLFADNAWSLGISGGFASPTAAELIAQADVVLGAGVALNMWTTRHGRLLSPNATVIQIDHDADAIGAHQRVDIAVVGDVSEAARALVAEVGQREYAGSGWRTPALGERLREGAWQRTAYDDASDAAHIDPRTLSIALDALLPVQRTLAIDSGHFMGYPAMYLRVPDEHGFVFTQAFQAVGLGLGTAIGAAVARPDRLTVAALGDGGALIGLSDFETVGRLGLRMLIVVYNDAAYGAEVHHFGPHGHPLDLVQFPDVDFAALGRAVGLHGATVRQPDDLRAVTEWLASGNPPGMVVDAKVVPTVVAEWLEEAFRGH
jgi:acetolactate synthase-1/2/3 large subunit